MKTLIMVSAFSAAVFSSAKADISNSSYGAHAISGGDDGSDAATTTGTYL